MTRLKPRQGSYESSLDAFVSGDFNLSAELLSAGHSAAEALLVARSFIRLGLPSKALDVVNSISLLDADHEVAAEALIAHISSLNALNRFDDASRFAIEARVRCISSGITALEAEFLFIEALGHLREGNYDLAEMSANSILDLESRTTTWLKPKTYWFNLAYWRFRACDLLGAIEGTRSNLDLKVQWLSRAFEEFDRSGVRDDYMESLVVSNVADVAIDVADMAEFALARAKRIEWSSALASNEFRTYSALAQVSSIAGDQLGALRFLRRCNSCAPTPALMLRSTIERSRILSDIGESFSSREELDHAVRLSKSIDWSNASEKDQRQLVFLAAQVASYSATEANRLLARYDGLKGSLPDTIAIRDDRFRGEELVARSTVFRANSETAQATRALIDALEIFRASNDLVNAGNTAAELAELTRESHYLEIARAQCEKRPHSILARKVARLEERMAGGALV